MRINELRDKIDKLGQKYDEKFIIEEIETFSNHSRITIYIDYYGSRYTIANILLKERYAFSTVEVGFDELPEELQEELFNIITEFARTPVDEREEVKKYQYKLKEEYWWIVGDFNKTYLNWLIDEEGARPLTLNDRYEAVGVETSFTDEEIEEVAKKHGVDLEMFDKIEVEDE